MPFALLDQLGEVGWLPDIPPGDHPMNSWTNVKNVKFTGVHMENVTGMGTFINLSTVMDTMHGLAGSKQGGSQIWFGAGFSGGTEKLVSFLDSGVVTDITPTGAVNDLVLTQSVQLTGGTFDDTYILAAGENSPVFAIPPAGAVVELVYSSGVALSTKLKPHAVRSWRQHLWALGITVVSETDSVPAGDYPRLLWCSDAADPGYIPGNWQASNPASLSRNYVSPFANFSGALVDLVPLGIDAVVYQENACHLLRYTGEFPGLISIGTIFTEFGLMAPNCAVQLAGTHIVLSGSDILQHNGQTATSILKNRTKRWLFNNISDYFYKNSFIAPNYQEKELYICFPLRGEEFPTQALVWNYEYNTFSVREFIEPVVGYSIGNQETPGISTVFTPSVSSLVLAGKDGEIFKLGTGPGSFHTESTVTELSYLTVNSDGDYLESTADGDYLAVRRAYEVTETPFECLAEKEGFAFTSEETPLHSRTLIREVWPELDGEFFTDLISAVPLAIDTNNNFLAADLEGNFLAVTPDQLVSKRGTVDIYVGGSELLASDMRWQGPFPFTIGEDDFIPVLIEGRRHGIRIVWDNGANIRVKRIGFDFEYIGRF